MRKRIVQRMDHMDVHVHVTSTLLALQWSTSIIMCHCNHYARTDLQWLTVTVSAACACASRPDLDSKRTVTRYTAIYHDDVVQYISDIHAHEMDALMSQWADADADADAAVDVISGDMSRCMT